MTDAYAHASEGQQSPEIDRLRQIDRFGLEAITGRCVFLHAEFVRLMNAEYIVSIFHHRAKSANWTEWVESHPEWADDLMEVEKLYNG